MALSLKPFSRVSRVVSRVRAIRRTVGETDPERLLGFFEPPSLGTIFKPLQKRAEFRELFLRARALRPRAVVEIGTNNGGTFFLLCRAASPDAVVISIDLPGGQFGGGYPVLRSPYFYLFASGRQRVHLIRQDSHAAATQDWVRGRLAGRPIDLLFIDGDHSYSGVKQDFETYGPLVRPGGLIALHDILPAPPEICGGVPDFWWEVAGRYHGEQIVEDPAQGKMGIGVIRVPVGGIQSGPTPW